MCIMPLILHYPNTILISKLILQQHSILFEPKDRIKLFQVSFSVYTVCVIIYWIAELGVLLGERVVIFRTRTEWIHT